LTISINLILVTEQAGEHANEVAKIPYLLRSINRRPVVAIFSYIVKKEAGYASSIKDLSALNQSKS